MKNLLFGEVSSTAFITKLLMHYKDALKSHLSIESAEQVAKRIFKDNEDNAETVFWNRMTDKVQIISTTLEIIMEIIDIQKIGDKKHKKSDLETRLQNKLLRIERDNFKHIENFANQKLSPTTTLGGSSTTVVTTPGQVPTATAAPTINTRPRSLTSGSIVALADSEHDSPRSRSSRVVTPTSRDTERKSDASGTPVKDMLDNLTLQEALEKASEKHPEDKALIEAARELRGVYEEFEKPLKCIIL